MGTKLLLKVIKTIIIIKNLSSVTEGIKKDIFILSTF